MYALSSYNTIELKLKFHSDNFTLSDEVTDQRWFKFTFNLLSISFTLISLGNNIEYQSLWPWHVLGSFFSQNIWSGPATCDCWTAFQFFRIKTESFYLSRDAVCDDVHRNGIELTHPLSKIMEKAFLGKVRKTSN